MSSTIDYRDRPLVVLEDFIESQYILNPDRVDNDFLWAELRATILEIKNRYIVRYAQRCPSPFSPTFIRRVFRCTADLPRLTRLCIDFARCLPASSGGCGTPPLLAACLVQSAAHGFDDLYDELFRDLYPHVDARAPLSAAEAHRLLLNGVAAQSADRVLRYLCERRRVVAHLYLAHYYHIQQLPSCTRSLLEAAVRERNVAAIRYIVERNDAVDDSTRPTVVDSKCVRLSLDLLQSAYGDATLFGFTDCMRALAAARLAEHTPLHLYSSTDAYVIATHFELFGSERSANVTGMLRHMVGVDYHRLVHALHTRGQLIDFTRTMIRVHNVDFVRTAATVVQLDLPRFGRALFSNASGALTLFALRYALSDERHRCDAGELTKTLDAYSANLCAAQPPFVTTTTVAAESIDEIRRVVTFPGVEARHCRALLRTAAHDSQYRSLWVAWSTRADIHSQVAQLVADSARPHELDVVGLRRFALPATLVDTLWQASVQCRAFARRMTRCYELSIDRYMQLRTDDDDAAIPEGAVHLLELLVDRGDSLDDGALAFVVRDLSALNQWTRVETLFDRVASRTTTGNARRMFICAAATAGNADIAGRIYDHSCQTKRRRCNNEIASDFA